VDSATTDLDVMKRPHPTHYVPSFGPIVSFIGEMLPKQKNKILNFKKIKLKVQN
jgi:hypothetical protein